MTNSFKIAILGDSGVGKTTFLTRLITNQFVRTYQPTIGKETRTLKVNCSGKDIEFECVDYSGQEKCKLITFDDDISGCIIMFSVTSRISYKNLNFWKSKIGNKNIPIVVCGNNACGKDRIVKPDDIDYHRINKLQYYDISVKSVYQLEKPFIYLAKKLLETKIHTCVCPCGNQEIVTAGTFVC